MPRGYRQGRLGEEIRKIISAMLLREIKDPRLSSEIISISGVDVTSDGSYATCHVIILYVGEDKEEKERREEQVLEGLRSAKGMFRNEIGKKIKLKRIPELIFKIDRSMEYGRHIYEIIDQLGINNGK